MKNCSNKNCNQENPQSLESFCIRKDKKDGRGSWCKTCVNEKERNRPKDKEISRIRSKKWRDNNSNRSSEISASYRERNPERVKESESKWRLAHKDVRASNQAKRRAAKLQRTPKWLTKEQLTQIEEFYSLAKEIQWLSEDSLEVDHIVPLQGEEVSGLHVPWNLQILPESINIRKSNKLL